MKSSRMLLASSVVIVAAAVAASAANRPQTAFKGPKRVGPIDAPTGGVLYNQTGSPGGSWTSQDFEPGFDVYDNQGADDFVVPAPGWDINEVFAPGVNAGVPVPLVNVTIFNNAGGIPGTAACTYANNAVSDGGTGNLTVALSPSCVLAPGTYWVSVQARMDFATGGQWFWTGNTAPANAAAKWQNPGDGFGTGCTTWGDLSACIAGDTDFGFTLSGVVVPVELQGFSIE